MDYYTNYKSCNYYYRIYNRNCKCREYLRFEIYKGIGWIQQSYYLDDVLHNYTGQAMTVFYNNGTCKYAWYHHGIHLYGEVSHTEEILNEIQEEFWNAVGVIDS